MTSTSSYHDRYVVNLLRARAAGALAESAAHKAVKHTTVAGRARELLVSQLLVPFLPPGQSCVTGQVIDRRGPRFRTRQDDIIVFDSTIAPPVHFLGQAIDGLYPFEGALLRFEVKTTLRSGDFDQFVSSSAEIARLKLTYPKDRPAEQPGVTGCMNVFFSWSSCLKDPLGAFHKAANKGTVLRPGSVSFICCPDRGFWKFGRSGWEVLDSDNERHRIAWFVGCLSNMSYLLRMERLGLAQLQTASCLGTQSQSVFVGGGIGTYLPDDVWTNAGV